MVKSITVEEAKQAMITLATHDVRTGRKLTPSEMLAKYGLKLARYVKKHPSDADLVNVPVALAEAYLRNRVK